MKDAFLLPSFEDNKCDQRRCIVKDFLRLFTGSAMSAILHWMSTISIDTGL